MPTLPQGYDPYYIPTTVQHPLYGGAISGPDCPIPDAYFCFLNVLDQQSFALNTMNFPGQRGYTVVRGKTLEATKQLAVSLGLTEANVDAAGRICWGGTDVLAMIPIVEYERRMQTSLKRQHDRYAAIPDQHRAAIDDLKNPGIRPVVEHAAVAEDRAIHSRREGQPFVAMPGGSGASTTADVPTRTTTRGTTDT